MSLNSSLTEDFNATTDSLFGAKVQLQLNDYNQTTLIVPWESINQRSTLFQSMDTGQVDIHNQVIKLSLERPEKFSILLHYLQTGILTEELKNSITFASYINDSIYLGIEELESHFMKLFGETVKTQLQEQVDFSISQPGLDFMSKFIAQFTEPDLPQQEILSLFQLVMKWMHHCEVKRDWVENTIMDHMEYTKLSEQQLLALVEKYPDEFNILIPSAYIMSNFVRKFNCRLCGQLLPHQFTSKVCPKSRAGAFHMP